MKALVTRLQRLEPRFGSAIAAMRPPRPSMAPVIAAVLDRWGIVRDSNESLLEVFARAIGLTPRELKAELMRRAGLERRVTENDQQQALRETGTTGIPFHTGWGADRASAHVYLAGRKLTRGTAD